MIKRLLVVLAVFALLLIPQAYAQDDEPIVQDGVPAPYSQEYLDWISNNKRVTLGQESDSGTSVFYGLTPMPVDLSHLKNNPPKFSRLTESLSARYTSVQVPSAYDLRTYSLLPSVRNQNPFGTCWAFSALGAMESNYMKNYPNADTPDLSEMHLAWFVYKDPAEGKAQATREPPDGYKDFILDQGGSPADAIAFLSRMSGPVNESSLPYPTKSVLGAYPYDTGDRPSDGAAPEDYGSAVMRLTDASFLSDYSQVTAPDTEMRKRLIMEKGAIQVVYYDVKSMYTKSGGTTVFFNNTTGTNTNHAVLIVGWDDDFSRENFPESMRPENNGAWLVRNSWGSGWADGGYFWMSYEQYIKYAVAYTVKTDSPKCYAYDDLGWCSSFSYNWMANVFQAGDTDELLTEIGFYTTDNNAPYKIYVYDLGKTHPGKPVPADVKTMTPNQSGTMTYAGYHTVELGSPVTISAGHYFSVVMRMDQAEGSSFDAMAAVERKNTYHPAVYHEGESYFFPHVTSGGKEVMPLGSYLSYWKEGKETGYSMNACIKAFTVEAEDGTAIDEAHFPDIAFRSYVSTNFDKDSDGILNSSETAAVTSINIDASATGVRSLQGIEYFTALESLDCTGHSSKIQERIYSLDVSSNTALKHLNCEHNQLTYLDLSKNTALEYLNCYNGGIKTLNISKNVALKYLDCSINPLKTLDLSNNTSLEYLNCGKTCLSALDVSSNEALTHLECAYQELYFYLPEETPKLTELDLSANKALKYLDCSEHNITALDLTSNTALEYLNCGVNPLGTLNLAANSALTHLECYSSGLSELDISNNSGLTYLDCTSNNLTSLDLSNNTSLKEIYCNYNRLALLEGSHLSAVKSGFYVYIGPQKISVDLIGRTNREDYPYSLNLNTANTAMGLNADINSFISRASIAALRDSDGVSLDYYVDSAKGVVYFSDAPASIKYDYETGIPLSSYAYASKMSVSVSCGTCLGAAVDSVNFPDTYFRAYITDKFDTDGNGFLNTAEIASADKINITPTNALYYLAKSLEGIQYLTSLTSLRVTNSYITSVDLSGCTSLKTIDLGANERLTAITLGSLPNLKTLRLGANEITALDISGCPALTYLGCSANQISELVLSNNPELATLICNGNKITVLDISKNPYLILAQGSMKLVYDKGVTIIDGASTAVPAFKTHSLLLSGQIGVNFYMDLPEISGVDYADTYMDFDIAGDKSNPEQMYDPEFMNKKKTYYGFRCYIKSIQMADTIRAVLHYGNNQTVTHEYSAKKYLDDSLAADIPDTERSLIEAIKDFGHYAQLYLSRVNGWSLGTAHEAIDCENEYSDSDIEAARQAVDGNAIVKDIPEDSGIKRIGFSLNLDADTTINLYIYPEDDYTDPIAAYIPGSATNDAIYYSDRNRYKVEINNIPAHRLAETFTVRVVGKKEFDVKVSAFSYVYAALNDGNAQDDEIDTVVSLYRYYTTNMDYRAANGL